MHYKNIAFLKKFSFFCCEKLYIFVSKAKKPANAGFD